MSLWNHTKSSSPDKHLKWTRQTFTPLSWTNESTSLKTSWLTFRSYLKRKKFWQSVSRVLWQGFHLLFFTIFWQITNCQILNCTCNIVAGFVWIWTLYHFLWLLQCTLYLKDTMNWRKEKKFEKTQLIDHYYIICNLCKL